MRSIILSILLLLPLMMSAQPQLQVTQFATGFTRPIFLTNCGDDRKFVVEKDGRIKIIDGTGTTLATPYLDITGPVYAPTTTGNEQGLLGMAFHPDYANNGYFFVNYIDNNQNTVIARYRANAPYATSNTADPNSEVVLMNITQPYSNHNGGCLQFGPDGYLYIGMGDGGSANDPSGNGQNTLTRLAKMLRIEPSVDANPSPAYNIPATNPFVVSSSHLPEIWAIGMRNPWRFSFDRQTGDLWIGDVGQDTWEEVDFEPAGSAGGLNYGWRCYEASHTFNTSGCGAIGNYTMPVAEYQHGGSTGCSITGGYVYRGSVHPGLNGYYLYTDYCTGVIWGLYPDGNGGFDNSSLLDWNNYQAVSFGEDNTGEIYLIGISNGNIYRLGDACTATPAPVITANSNVLSSDVQNSYQWYLDGTLIPGATSQTYSANSTGWYYVVATTSNNCVKPSDSLFIDITGLVDIQESASFVISPNPTRDHFTAFFNTVTTTDMVFVVTDMQGRRVQTDIVNANTRNLNLDVSAFTSGLYQMTVIGKDGIYTTNFVKQ